MTHGLEHYIADWSPAPVSSDDLLPVGRADEFAATLNLDERREAGSPLPPLWHWAYFLDWPRTDQLGEDGHPRDGHFLPPIPHRRRMFAGGRLAVESPLVLGRAATRESEIVGVTVKHGRTGEMLFVTVRHSYVQDGVLRMSEEQDLVYRSGDGATAPHARVTDDLATVATPWWTTPQPDSALLFRFSAVTGNAHRIHYDQPYTTRVEGYPGLVVHGPLLAIYMAELLRANAVDRTVKEFTFRLQRPVFLGDAFRVEGIPADSSASLAVVSGASTVHATATAVLA